MRLWARVPLVYQEVWYALCRRVQRHKRAAELLSKGTLPGNCDKHLGHSLAVFYNTYAEMIDAYQTDRDLDQFEPLPENQHKRI